MVQDESMKRNIQLLIVGNSHEHICRVINHYNPIHITLFTSKALETLTKEFANELLSQDLTIRIQVVNPFMNDAVKVIFNDIIDEYLFLKTIIIPNNLEWYIGLTGGTNLMSIAAAFASVKLGIRTHYVRNPDFCDERSGQDIIEFNLSHWFFSEHTIPSINRVPLSANMIPDMRE